MQVAEEHQPEALADLARHQAPDGFAGVRMPVPIGFRVGLPGAQRVQQLGLARRRGKMGKQPPQFGLGMQAEQFIRRHGRVPVQPAQRLQRRGGRLGRADFLVDQAAGAEPRPAPQQQPRQQRLRRPWQGRVVGDETALRLVQHIVIALGHPGQRALEVVRVVITVRRKHRPGRRAGSDGMAASATLSVPGPGKILDGYPHITLIAGRGAIVSRAPKSPEDRYLRVIRPLMYWFRSRKSWTDQACGASFTPFSRSVLGIRSPLGRRMTEETMTPG